METVFVFPDLISVGIPFIDADDYYYMLYYCILQVSPGSKAAEADLCIGDTILAIDGESTGFMTHLQAQNKIKGCLEEMVLSIDR